MQKTHLHCLGARFPFRPASRRAVQASGSFYPKENFRTGPSLPMTSAAATGNKSGLRLPSVGVYCWLNCRGFFPNP